MQPTVSLIKCQTYGQDTVNQAVKQAIDSLGGIESFIKAGQRVLIKPNLVLGSQPESAVCTHPAVLKAVILQVQGIGAQAVVGDSPGGPFTAGWVKPMYRKAGWLDVVEQTGAILNSDYSDSHVSIPEGIAIKGVELGNFITSADVIITLPKLKTHGLMHLTGATKILFGAIPGTVKLAYHAKFPDRDQFADMLIDLLTFIRPSLSIMDAITAMDGTGPTAGQPFQVGAIIASADSIALDVVAAHLVHLDVNDIPTMQAAKRRALTRAEVTDINILGEKLTDFDTKGFRSPGTRASKKSILTLLGRNLRTVAKDRLVAVPQATDQCIACGLCARSCPVQAITIPNDRAVMDLNKCIRCYCCHELCPQKAIELRKPILGRVLGQWR